MGRLEAIWIKRARRGQMDAAPEAVLEEQHGLVGSASWGGRRQVTLLEREVWERHMTALGASVDPSARRANFLVSGCALADSPNRVLRVGNCRVRVLGETKPCERMDEIVPGLEAVMRPNWGGGAFGEIITGGTVRVGDPVAWDDEA